MCFHSYLNSAIQILAQYRGEEPFAAFIKKYFVQHKKYGSNDRKRISHLCFCYFRLGRALMDMPVDERILMGLFLCTDSPNEMLQQLKPEWNRQVQLPVDKKLLIINHSLLIQNVFPWKDELSNGIEHEIFCRSFFIQPDLFLRLRPGKEKIVEEKLTASNIHYAKLNDTCLALPNSSKIDTVVELDKEAVVQDCSSQQTARFIQSEIKDLHSGRQGRKPKTAVWDCCAASGGKSIMLHDLIPGIELTVSDIRESILANLKKRFKQAGIVNYHSFIADLTYSSLTIPHPTFDLILADVPCSGSGTWGRTPEQLYYFNKKKIAEYAILQKNIVAAIIPYLKPGGYLLYITCSVFKKENEEVVDFIKEKFQLELIKLELLAGYSKKADTLFAALFKKHL